MLKKKTYILIYYLAIILLFFLLLFSIEFTLAPKFFSYAQETLDPDKFELTILGDATKEVVFSKSSKATYKGNYELKYDHEVFTGETIVYELGDETIESPENIGVYKVTIKVGEKSWTTDGSGNELELVINPKLLNIEVSGANKYTYMGTKQERTISILDEEILDSEKENIIECNYIGEKYGNLLEEKPINVDKYVLDFKVIDENYHINEGSISYKNDLLGLEILHKSLVVTVNDITVKYGDEYNLTYAIAGFVNGENEDVLTIKPIIESTFKNPGKYSISAKFAKAENYVFEYIPGQLTINNFVIESKINGNLNQIKILGNFSPDCELNFNVSSNADLMNARKEAYETRGMGKLNDKQHLVFDITKQSGDFYLDSKFNVTINEIKVNRLFKNSIKIIAVDKSNKVTLVENYSYSGENLSFSMPAMEGTVFILTEELILALVLFSFLFVILLVILFLITARINYKNRIKELENVKNSQKGEYKWSNKKSKRQR